ncbi:MAG: hypothetical protein AAFX06_29680 [Planctomycetota bacterium]
MGKHLQEPLVSADANNAIVNGSDGGALVLLNSSGFSGNLSPTDDSVQSVANVLDALSVGGGGGLTWQTITTGNTANLASGNGYVVNGQTTTGVPSTLNFPTSPNAGDQFAVVSNGSGNNGILFDRGFELIDGQTDETFYTLIEAGESGLWTYDGTGWISNMRFKPQRVKRRVVSSSGDSLSSGGVRTIDFDTLSDSDGVMNTVFRTNSTSIAITPRRSRWAVKTTIRVVPNQTAALTQWQLQLRQLSTTTITHYSDRIFSTYDLGFIVQFSESWTISTLADDQITIALNPGRNSLLQSGSEVEAIEIPYV